MSNQHIPPKNAVVLTSLMKYISAGRRSIYSTTHAVYIRFLGVCYWANADIHVSKPAYTLCQPFF